MSKYLPEISIVSSDLPSKGLLYPSNIEIQYTPFTFGELLKYSQSFLNIKKKYLYILDKIEIKGMDKLNLTLSDFYYISLLINLSTFETFKMTVKRECIKCKETIEITVDSRDIEFDELKEKASKATIIINGRELEFSPITIKDFITLFDIGKQSDLYYLFAIQCRSENVNLDELATYISNPTIVDSKKFDKIDEAFHHAITPVETVCKNCFTKNKLILEGGMENLISPFCRTDESITNEIHFS